MSSSSDFYHPDGGYSWIVLATIVLHSFAFSFIACNQGVMSDYYPQLFDEEQAKTNIISALAMGVFLFCSKFLPIHCIQESHYKMITITKRMSGTSDFRKLHDDSPETTIVPGCSDKDI